MPDDVGVVEFLHDIDFLVDVLLEEGLLLEVRLADDLDCELLVGVLWVRVRVLSLTRMTSPKAPFPIIFTMS